MSGEGFIMRFFDDDEEPRREEPTPPTPQPEEAAKGKAWSAEDHGRACGAKDHNNAWRAEDNREALDEDDQEQGKACEAGEHGGEVKKRRLKKEEKASDPEEIAKAMLNNLEAKIMEQDRLHKEETETLIRQQEMEYEKKEKERQKIKNQGLSEYQVLSAMTFLNALFNTVTGVCAWVPAVYEGQRVVIVSVPFLVWVFGNAGETNMNETKVKRFFGKLGEDAHPVFNGLDKVLQIDYNSEEFRNTLKTTPFKIPRKQRSSNADDFFVVPLAGWMGLMRRQGGECDINQMEANEKFGHWYAFHKNAYRNYRIFEGLKFTRLEQTKIPVMGVEWWGELFSPVVRECFGLEESECTHVIGWEKVVESKVPTYEEVKARVSFK